MRSVHDSRGRMKTFFCALVVLAALSCGGDDPPNDETGDAGSGGSSAGSAAGGSSAAGANGGSGGAGGPGGSSGSGGAGGSSMAFTLTVVVDGDGKVTSTPPGIECGSSCEGTFPAGTEVELTATEQGGVLTGWAGACTGGSECAFTLDADAQLTATFEPFSVGANAHGVAVTPDGTQALVTLSDEAGTLQVLSLDDGSIADSIDLASFPGAVAVTPDGTKAVVNHLSTVSVVTLSTKTVQSVPSPCASDTLYGIAVTPDSTRAVTTMFNGSCVSNTLAVIDLASASIGDQHPISGTLAAGVAVTSDGSSALVARGIVGSLVDRVALVGGAVTGITDTSSSFGIAVTPDGTEALIASGDGDTVKRVSLATSAVTGSIEFASNQDAHNIAISSDGALAVVVGSFDVGVLSLASGTVVETFGGGGRSVAITPDGKRALVTAGSTLRVYSLAP